MKSATGEQKRLAGIFSTNENNMSMKFRRVIIRQYKCLR